MDVKKILQEMERKAEEIKSQEALKDNQKVEAIINTKDLLEPGKYFAITKKAVFLKDINAKYGLVNVIDVEFEVYVESKYGSIENKNLRERYFQSKISGSKYVSQLSEILGKDSRKGFNIEELAGKSLEIEIVHNSSSDGKKTYVNIESLRKVDMDKIKEVV